MNRNVESHFAQVPADIDLHRSQFDRSSSVKFSASAGQLIPFFWDEVLPGDTFRISTSKIVRMMTLKDPIMDNVYLDTYFFFVPNRIIWQHWKQFCGESERAWYSNVDYTVPKIVPPSNGFGVNSIADYLGLPLNINDTIKVSALPFRAYAQICTDFFRDENLTDPCVINYGDSDTAGDHYYKESPNPDQGMWVEKGGEPFHVAKYHDYFTSCLPGPLASEPVEIPVSAHIPPIKVGVGLQTHNGVVGTKGEGINYALSMSDNWNASTTKYVRHEDDNSLSLWDSAVGSGVYPTNLYTDDAYSVGSSISIMDLRTAFQVQKFYERSARGGRRYIETLKSQFGVTSPDARLQRPEYLGGNRIALNVHQVEQNAPADQGFVGSLGANSVTSDFHDDLVFSASEHGIIMGVCCLRYDHTYGQGIEKSWLRNTPFDFYWPVFANISEQPVLTNELFFDDTATTPAEISARDKRIFGFQEAWASYRYKPSRVCGQLRPDYEGSLGLSSWHLADDYETVPTLSSNWIREDPNNINRVLQTGSSSGADQYFADFYVKNYCTRCMPVYSVPGLIDHN